MVRVYDAVDDRQTEASAAGDAVSPAKELDWSLVQLVLRDTDACVADRDDNLAIALPGAQAHPPAVTRESQRIIDDVIEEQIQCVAIARHGGGRAWKRRVESAGIW